MQSGDAIVFPGSWAHMIRHGVHSIIKDTCPQEISDADSTMVDRRISLQYRQVPAQVRNSLQQLDTS